MRNNAFIKVLKNSAFRNLWLSQLFSQVFLNMLIFFMMIRIFQLTGSNVAVSGFVLAVTIPNFLFGAVAGVFVDRWDRKIVMFLSHFLRVLAVVAFLLSSESLTWIYVLMILISIITQFFFPAEAATISQVVEDPHELVTANSLFSLTFFSSVIIGNVMAGPFLRFFGSHPTLLIIASAFLLASFIISRIPGQRVRDWAHQKIRRDQTFSVRKELAFDKKMLFLEFREGVHFLRTHRLVRHGLVLMSIAQIMIATLSTIAPGFGTKIMKIDTTDVSVLVMAPAAVGMMIGAVIVGGRFRHTSKEKMIKVGLMVVATLLLCFSFVDVIAMNLTLPIVLTALLILTTLGLFNAFMDIPINTMLQENTPLNIRSRVYGVLSTLTGGASILPVLVAGTFADLFGVRFVMILLSVVLLTISLFNHREFRKVAAESP